MRPCYRALLGPQDSLAGYRMILFSMNLHLVYTLSYIGWGAYALHIYISVYILSYVGWGAYVLCVYTGIQSLICRMGCICIGCI